MALKISASDISRLQRGWSCIVENKEYLKMCKDNTLEEEGMSIFVFKRPSSNPGDSNCDYYYTTKDTSLWDKYISRAPTDVMVHYKSGKSFMVCVSVPAESGQDELEDTIHKIGIFDIDRLEEISD